MLDKEMNESFLHPAFTDRIFNPGRNVDDIALGF
jgi:hypothetical protein